MTYHYDALSRLARESQAVRLDGAGNVAMGGNYQLEQTVESPFYDKQGNRLQMRSENPDRLVTDIELNYSYDGLNRLDVLDVSAFDASEEYKITYGYLGWGRLQKQGYADKAVGLTIAEARWSYDAKRRPTSNVLRDQSPGTPLMASDTLDVYNQVDQPLMQSRGHDKHL